MILAERHERERIEHAIGEAVTDWSLAPVIEALRTLQGVGLISAVTFLFEVGNVRRFESPRQLMAYLGLVPSESSTGDRVRRSGLSKCSNARVRGTLTESAWCYRYPARIGREQFYHQRKV
jgi:transposase